MSKSHNLRGLMAVRAEATERPDIPALVKDLNSTFAEFKTHHNNELRSMRSELDDVVIAIKSRGGQVDNDRGNWRVIDEAVKSDVVQAMREGRTRAAIVPLSASLRDVRAAVTSGSYSQPGQFDPRIAGVGSKASSLIELLPHIPVAAGSFEFNQVTGAFAQAAAVQVNEGDAKAVQAIPMALQTAAISTIAVTTGISEQILADAAALREQLGNLLMAGVLEKLEADVINGAGGTGTINGLASSGTAFTATVGATNADALSECAMHLRAVGWHPRAVVLSPAAWHGIRTSKAAGDGQYMSGNFNIPSPPSVWDLPVIVSPAIADTSAIVLDTQQVALLDRQSVNVLLGYSGTDFSSNMRTMRVELRAGLAVFAPSAVQIVTLA